MIMQKHFMLKFVQMEDICIYVERSLFNVNIPNLKQKQKKILQQMFRSYVENQ